MQSTLDERDRPHVAIIMDGNGRWATRRGLPRRFGHHQGANAVRRVVQAAPELGVEMLTLFAFSSDNWRRPPDEVRGLMTLLREFLEHEAGSLVKQGVELGVVGRRDRLPADLVETIAAVERRTCGGPRLRLRVALDYSSRYAMAAAASDLASDGALSPQTLAHSMQVHRTILPNVDLLIRTGGEKRLSDFLLWESAYAELVFTDVAWPDFDAADLREALAEYRCRDRRFGTAGTSAAQAMVAQAMVAQAMGAQAMGAQAILAEDRTA